MALDLDDQEQLDEFKVWWNKYGKLTINLVLVAIVAYAAWQGYQYFKHKKAVEASELYQSLGQLDPSKTEEIKAVSSKLIADYAGADKALSGDFDPGYIGLKEDLQGDILLAQGKAEEAKKVYAAALANLDSEGRLYLFTKQKLDSLGS